MSQEDDFESQPPQIIIGVSTQVPLFMLTSEKLFMTICAFEKKQKQKSSIFSKSVPGPKERRGSDTKQRGQKISPEFHLDILIFFGENHLGKLDDVIWVFLC